MFKKLVVWIKSLFTPVEIKESKVDEFIANQVRMTDPRTQSIDSSLEKDEVVTAVDVTNKTVEVRSVVYSKTPPKPLDEQLASVELPVYVQGKKLPPKAKRQYIEQAKRAVPRKMSDNPASFGNSQVNAASGIDPVNAAVYGYAAATILSDDTPSAPVEECRSSAVTSAYSSSHSSSGDSYSSSDSSSSYDSGSSSCD